MDYLFDLTIEGEDYSTTQFVANEIESCIFKECNFADLDLSKKRFSDSEFLDCDLSNAKINETSFQNIKFTNCKMLGLQFDTCNEFLFSIHLDGSNLSHSVFYQTKLTKSSFNDCRLQDVDFSEVDMSSVTIHGCDLLNAKFERTNLENSDLRESLNYTIDPENNMIRGAKFSLPSVISLLDKYRLIIE